MRNSEPNPDLPQGQEAYRRLIAEIRAGGLKPGDRLLEVDLANRLGISRTPVREAIRQLEGDGLVAHVPRLGASVRQLDPGEVTELYEMRGVLEGTAARLAARTASDVERAELDGINAEMAAAQGNPARLYELNRQFHAALLDAARNRYLARSVAGLQKTLLLLGPTTMEQEDRARDAVDEHAAVLDALRARDETGAEQAMRRHVAAAHAIRLRQFRARPAADPTD
ncbi:MAG: GntR family transcriptional regulator [Rhodobacteraceae bacterium]|nr:GntR family transcriptional regulator [Paracoccaceae bacterium]